MKLSTTTLSLALMAFLTPAMADEKKDHAPKWAHPDVYEMSARIPCVYTCLLDLRDVYDVESKTQSELCYWDAYAATMFLVGKATDCIIEACDKETIRDFQPSKFCGPVSFYGFNGEYER